MSRLCMFLLLFISSFILKSQFSISGTFIGLHDDKIMLLQANGSKNDLVDSTHLNDNGSFKFIIAPELSPGSYQLLTESGVSVDMILNKENVQFVALYDGFDQQVQIIESKENLAYYEFMNLKDRNLFKLDILSNVLEFYPKEDDFYQLTTNKVLKLRDELDKKAIELIRNNPTALASHFIKFMNPVFANVEMSEEQQKEYLKKHFFNHVDFNDTVLLNSHQLNAKLIQYLSLYQDQDVDRETFEMNLLKGVDTILQKTSVNQQMYTYVVEFLIGGFEAIGFEKGLEYIAAHSHLEELCVNEEKLNALQHKFDLIKKLAVGKTAPNFVAEDLHGNVIRLDEISASKTILFFWASWCPHCKEMISEMNEIFSASDDQFSVIGISIDTSLTDLKKIIEEYSINWPVIADFEGWDGEIADQYGLVATPTIFLLDSDKTIFGKPINKNEFKKLIE